MSKTKKKINGLINKYESEIFMIKRNKKFKELSSSVQTVGVLREVVEDLKLILKEGNKNDI